MDNLTITEKNLINTHAFAQIMSSKINELGFAELVYCPLQLLDNGLLLGHLAANNPLLKLVKNDSKVQVIFRGPHGYISPRWHHEQVVPTWNYASISMHCSVSIIEDNSAKLVMMESISRFFDPNWNFDKFNNAENSKRVQQMLSAITVFTLKINDVNSTFKLSQNRSTDCRAAFKANLESNGNKALANIQLI